MSPVTVFVVEDHTLVRQSLVELVAGAPDLELLGEAASVEDARPRVLAQPPDVLVLDVSLPGADGLTFAQEIADIGLPCRVLMLTMHDDATSLRRATEAGVDGYLTKSTTQAELLTGIRSLASGGQYLSASIAGRLMDVARHRAGPDHLTERESEILQLMANGLRVREIADRLALSSKTVTNHLGHIYPKLDVESGAQAVVTAFRRGLIRL